MKQHQPSADLATVGEGTLHRMRRIGSDLFGLGQSWSGLEWTGPEALIGKR